MKFEKISALLRLKQGSEKMNARISAYTFDAPELAGLPLAVFRGVKFLDDRLVHRDKWGVMNLRTGGALIHSIYHTRERAVEAACKDHARIKEVIADPAKIIRSLSKFHSATKIIEVQNDIRTN